jgi:hypothetical protein
MAPRRAGDLARQSQKLYSRVYMVISVILTILCVIASGLLLAFSISILIHPRSFSNYGQIVSRVGNGGKRPSPQSIYKAILRQDMQSLDRGVLAYSPLNKLKTGAATEFEVTVTDVGRGRQETVVTKVGGLLVYQQDVPTGGIIGLRAVHCQDLKCHSESSPTQPVLARGDSATWRWRIIAGTPGKARIILRADTYDQGSQQTLREEIIFITGNVVPTVIFNQKQTRENFVKVTKGGVNLVDKIGAMATAVVAVGGLVGWFVMKGRERERRGRDQASPTPKPETNNDGEEQDTPKQHA